MELQRFFECSKDDAERTNNLLWHTLFRLLAFSGMRKGEALALTWNDLDFMNESVTINKTLTRGLENRLIIQAPKTAAGKRAIALDPITLSMLEHWRKRQATDFLKLGFNTMSGEQLIFPNTKNELMVPYQTGQETRQDYQAKRSEANHRSRLPAHALQPALRSGRIDQRSAGSLGHSDIKVTMNIYAHVTEKAKEKTAEKFAKYVNF